MTYLVDTNVLLRFAHRADPAHLLVRAANRRLRQSGHHFATLFQNRSEFWNVSTRPVVRNGYGLDITAAEAALGIIEREFPLLPEHPQTYATWLRLVVAYGVSGVQVHDARLAAAMLAHGVTHVLTFNVADFGRYAPEGLAAIDPATI